MSRRIKRSDRHKNKFKIGAKKGFFHVGVFIIANMLIGATISAPLVIYGPFKNLKEYYITTAMTTLSHQYLATMLFSEDEINKVMEKNSFDGDKNSSIDEIKIEEAEVIKEQISEPKDIYDGIKLIDISNDRYKGYILIVDNSKRVSLGIPDTLGKKGKKLDEIVKQENGIAGINAGGFEDEGGTGNGGFPLGVLIHEGNVVSGKEGQNYPVIGIDDKGVLILGTYNLQRMRELNIKEGVTFHPFLIVDGEPMIKNGNGGWGVAPRTAIGQRKDGSIVMLTIDGRQVGSLGATLREVQDLLLQYDVYNGANLDGGASTTIYYKDNIINKPSSKYGPRDLPSAFVVK